MFFVWSIFFLIEKLSNKDSEDLVALCRRKTSFANHLAKIPFLYHFILWPSIMNSGYWFVCRIFRRAFSRFTRKYYDESKAETKYEGKQLEIGRESTLDVFGKLIITAIWTYGVQLWGYVSKANLTSILARQSTILGRWMTSVGIYTWRPSMM